MKDFALEDFESLSKWVSAYLQSHIQEGSIEKNTGCYSWGIWNAYLVPVCFQHHCPPAISKSTPIKQTGESYIYILTTSTFTSKFDYVSEVIRDHTNV